MSTVFGPLTGIVAVDSLERGHRCPRGLHGSIFARNLAVAMRAVREIEAVRIAQDIPLAWDTAKP